MTSEIQGARRLFFIAFLSLGAPFTTSVVCAQAAAEVDKSIANLPPAERAYERFRVWLNALPPDQQHDGKVSDRYRAYLKARGASEHDADAEVEIIQQQGARAEVERWNHILTAEKPRFNTKPNAFLTEVVKTRTPGTALDIGMGQGRNSIWLAQQGWDVTGFDPAEKAVALAKQTAENLGVNLKTGIDTMEKFDYGERRWDLILLSYVGGRGMTDVLQRALKPGGILVIEAFHRDATKGRSVGAAVVFDTGELPQLFPQLRVVRYEEPVSDPDFGQVKVRLVRYCAERPLE